MTKATAQEVQTNKVRDRAATEVALAGLTCVGIQSGFVAGRQYTSTARWWATLMRHYLPTGPPSPLALGVGVAAFAAVLVALACSALGATSGLVRADCAAVALTAVAVAADEYSAAAQGAEKSSGWW